MGIVRVKSAFRKGRLVKAYSRSNFGRRGINKLKRIHQKGGLVNVSSSAYSKKDLQTRSESVGLVRGKQRQRQQRRAHIGRKQILNNTYR
jgi:hypothetical protein